MNHNVQNFTKRIKARSTVFRTKDEVHVKQRPINSNTEKISVEHNLPESSREETSVTLRKTWTEQPEGKMGHEKA